MSPPDLSPSPELEGLRSQLSERLRTGSLELPPLSQTASQVLSSCDPDSDADARELAELVHRDQALAGHVLKVANSALYVPSEPIVSLQQAVSRLGMATLTEIALTVAIRGSFQPRPGQEDLVNALWRHSAAAGVCAKEIARRQRHNVEGAFLCGLFHDVGKPVILQLLGEVEEELSIPLDPEAVEWMLHELHTEVAPLLVERWSLPEWMEAAIQHHHDPAAAGSGPKAERAWLACFADELAHALTGEDPDPERLIRHPAAVELNLYSEDVHELFELRESVLDAMRTFA